MDIEFRAFWKRNSLVNFDRVFKIFAKNFSRNYE